ncbi:hypothetical protein COCCADRAFT_97657, partial [Bipolaris zeicola 26-R-13]
TSGHMYNGCVFLLLFYFTICARVCVHTFVLQVRHGLVEEFSVLAGRTCMSLGTLWGCQGRGNTRYNFPRTKDDLVLVCLIGG